MPIRGTNQRAEPRHSSPSAIKFETSQIAFEKKTAGLWSLFLPQDLPRPRKEVPGPVQLDPEKRDEPFVNAACDDSFVSRRIFVTDRTSRISFLVDPGADICVYLRNKLRGPADKDTYELFAATHCDSRHHPSVPRPVTNIEMAFYSSGR